MMSAQLVPLVPLAIVVAVDAWVYSDARARAEQGARVTFRAGTFQLDTPVTWTVACLLLFVLFFPLYLVSRT